LGRFPRLEFYGKFYCFGDSPSFGDFKPPWGFGGLSMVISESDILSLRVEDFFS